MITDKLRDHLTTIAAERPRRMSALTMLQPFTEPRERMATCRALRAIVDGREWVPGVKVTGDICNNIVVIYDVRPA